MNLFGLHAATSNAEGDGFRLLPAFTIRGIVSAPDYPSDVEVAQTFLLCLA